MCLGEEFQLWKYGLSIITKSIYQSALHRDNTIITNINNMASGHKNCKQKSSLQSFVQQEPAYTSLPPESRGREEQWWGKGGHEPTAARPRGCQAARQPSVSRKERSWQQTGLPFRNLSLLGCNFPTCFKICFPLFCQPEIFQKQGLGKQRKHDRTMGRLRCVVLAGRESCLSKCCLSRRERWGRRNAFRK